MLNEMQVGDVREYNGRKYEAVADPDCGLFGNCEDCALEDCTTRACVAVIGQCSALFRKDGKTIIFKLKSDDE